jgi:ribosomal protein S18 acetylase RimI-like enzyme
MSANIETPTSSAQLRIRPARSEDAADIARLFLIASDGLAAYIWSRNRPSGTSILENGAMRYARRNTAFSYENCTIAEMDGSVAGMLHSYQMPHGGGHETDPVLRPYAELEDAGSLYISGIAVHSDYRDLGIGNRLLDMAEAKAAALGIGRLSLICFAENRGAMRLYLKRGYHPIDRRRIVKHPALRYKRGDALLMRLDLPRTAAAA